MADPRLSGPAVWRESERERERGPTGSRVSFYTVTQSISVSSFPRPPENRGERSPSLMSRGNSFLLHQPDYRRVVLITNTEGCKQFEEWPTDNMFPSNVWQHWRQTLRRCVTLKLPSPHSSHSLSRQTQCLALKSNRNKQHDCFLHWSSALFILENSGKSYKNRRRALSHSHTLHKHTQAGMQSTVCRLTGDHCWLSSTFLNGCVILQQC